LLLQKKNKKVEPLSDSDAVENSSSDIPKKSKKKLLTIIALLITLAIVGVGVFMKMGDGSNNENPIVEPVENESEESSKSIEEIEKVIEDAEKDSVVNDIIEAAEAIELIR
jgi:flagellar basal body-associated protein FliL